MADPQTEKQALELFHKASSELINLVLGKDNPPENETIEEKAQEWLKAIEGYMRALARRGKKKAKERGAEEETLVSKYEKAIELLTTTSDILELNGPKTTKITEVKKSIAEQQEKLKTTYTLFSGKRKNQENKKEDVETKIDRCSRSYSALLQHDRELERKRREGTRVDIGDAGEEELVVEQKEQTPGYSIRGSAVKSEEYAQHLEKVYSSFRQEQTNDNWQLGLEPTTDSTGFCTTYTRVDDLDHEKKTIVNVTFENKKVRFSSFDEEAFREGIQIFLQSNGVEKKYKVTGFNVSEENKEKAAVILKEEQERLQKKVRPENKKAESPQYGKR